MAEEYTDRPHGEQRTQGNPWLIWGVVIFLIVVIAMMGAPVVMKSNKKAAMTEATSNAKQVFYLLVEFDQDYGEFPGDKTAVGDLEGYRGEYSNDYLAQLIQGGYTRSEEIFYAKGGSGSNRKPDNVLTDRRDQLSEGECGFAYVKGLDITMNVKKPVLLAPMYGDGFKFNSDIYQGKCIILRVDGAVKQRRLDKERHAKMGGGQTVFGAGPDSVWGSKGFDSTTLCYAKKPYSFTPRLIRRMVPGDWLYIGLALILVILVGGVLCQARQKAPQQSKVESE